MTSEIRVGGVCQICSLAYSDVIADACGIAGNSMHVGTKITRKIVTEHQSEG